jgi:predicted Zn-dependent protease with MMP-like domain
VDPDSLDALHGAAHLYTVQLPSSREFDELGALYADRGFELAQAQHDAELSLSFARLAAMAYNDVGQAKEALERADWVLERKKADPEALYERAAALFELCRFAEARPAFEALLEDPERAAFAHRHLGLVLERQGKRVEADRQLAEATRLDPKGIPPAVLLPPEEFRAEVAAAVAALPADMRHDLRDVPVQMEDLPALADLTANDPPLSPQILGLFRGPPLQEDCEPGPDGGMESPCRSVVLYRRNLGRAVRTREELVEQIRVTLLHEVGHLRGEDDGELAARGLE